jgi:trehalose 6-phosphate synthase/phosphatase
MTQQYKRLVIVAYRIPFKIENNNGQQKLIQNSGGLVSAILSLSKNMKDAKTLDPTNKIQWVGYSDSFFEENDKDNDLLTNDTFDVHPVHIEPELNDAYYGGFCNSTIWPLFHYYPYITNFEDSDFQAFIDANQLFHDRLKDIIQPGDLVWVHDYQLMTLPALLRSTFPEATIGFFLHVPFPTFEVFRILPTEWKKTLLEGMLGSDLIGFHTSDYTNYFLRCIENELGYKTKNLQVYAGNRRVKAEHFPIGIDYDQFHNMYDNPEVVANRKRLFQEAEGKKIIFSVDRLDYSKGLIYRLKSFELFLETYPEYARKVIFYMIVVPSRDSIIQYQELKHELEETVGRIVGKFGDFDWRPIIYLYRSLNFPELLASYTAADIALITPIRDGMNLVCKEFVASRKDERGVLILSDKAGAVSELNGAMVVNPFDKKSTAEAIAKALEMPESEQRDRIKLMQHRVKNYDVFHWAEKFMEELSVIKDIQKLNETKMISKQEIAELVIKYKNAKNRLILLDYDGTLVNIQNKPAGVFPSIEALKVVKRMANTENNTLAVVTGRDSNYISQWFADMPIHIFAEHGSFMKEPNKPEWHAMFTEDSSWKEEIIGIFKEYTELAKGSQIEYKASSVAWHYRNVDSEYAFTIVRELLETLKERITPEMNIHILDGKKVIEIKQNGCDKGSSSKKMAAMKDFDFILSIGDDVTDEDMFMALPPEAYTFKVGDGITQAKLNLQSPREVISLLEKLYKG